MSTRLATATLRIEADSSGLSKSLKDTELQSKSLKTHFDNLGYSTKGITTGITSMAGSFLVANLGAAAIGGTMTAAFNAVESAIISTTTKAANYGDAIRDASVRTSLTTQTMSGLKLMAEQNGASFDDVSTSLKFLAKNFVSATEDGKEQIKAFGGLGISTKDLEAAHGNLDVVLRLVMDRFREMPDGAKKTELEMALLGKTGNTLNEMMSQGSKALDGYINLTKLLGTNVTPEAATAADEFNDALNILDQAATGFSVTVGNELIPALTDAIDLTAAAVVTGKDYVVELANMVKGVAAAGEAYYGTNGLNTALAGFISVIPGASKLLTDTAVNYSKLKDAQAEAAGGLETYNLLTEAARDAREKQAKADDAAAAAAKRFKAEVDQVIESVVGNTEKTDALRVGIEKMGAAHIPTEAIAAKLSSRLIEEANNAKLLGTQLDPLIGSMAAIAMAQKAIHDQGVLQLFPANLAQLTAEYEKAQADLASINHANIMQLDYEDSQMRKNQLASLQQLIKDTKPELEAQLAAQQMALEIYQQNEKAAAEATAAKLKQHVEDVKKAHEDLRDSAGHIFDDMLLKGESVFGSLKNLLKGGALSLGRTIFEDINDALLGDVYVSIKGFFDHQVKNIIDGAFGGIGDALGRALAGGGGGGSDSGSSDSALDTALGSFGGKKGVSSLLGGLGGAGSILGTWGGGATTVTLGGATAGSSTTAGTGLLGGVHALFTNPWTAVVGAGILGAAAWIKSQAHHEANTFVQQFQNPFHAQLASIVDGFNAQYAAGHLDVESATGIWDLTHALWGEFLSQGDQFALGGSDEEKVWGQAKNQLGPLMVQIFSDMQAKVATLSAQKAEADARQNGIKDALGMIEHDPAPPSDHVTKFGGGGGGGAKNFDSGALVTTSNFAGGGAGSFDSPVLDSFATGMPWVPQTGIYQLHQGEAVIPASENRGGGAVGGISIGDITILAGKDPAEAYSNFIEGVRNNRAGMRTNLIEALGYSGT